MLDKYLEAPFALARFRSSPVGPYVDGFAAVLYEWGYAQGAGSSCLRHAVHLGRWAAGHGVEVEAFDEGVIGGFVAHLGACTCPLERAGSHERAGTRVRVFLEYLRSIGVAPPAAAVPTPPVPRVLAEFRDWMLQYRGVTKATVKAYSGAVRGLISRLGDDPSRYAPQALRATVLALAAGYGTSKAEQVVSATRAFLGYQAVIGRCSPDLANAVPKVAAWKQTTLPKHLPAEAVEQLLASCNAHTPAGQRDRAVLLFLARLGLRAGDVMSLRLPDIDWADATFKVAGKGRRQVRLPLPQDVGDAVLTYLESGRPQVAFDHVFVTVRPPWRPLTSSATVAYIVGRAITRAGVDAPTHGSHLLRHSAATGMLREGASLASIGAVLRHRALETTEQYARVDGRLLREVAQAWPDDTPRPSDEQPAYLRLLGQMAQPWLEVSPC